MDRRIKFKLWNKSKKQWVHKEPCDILGEMILLGGWTNCTTIQELSDLVPLQYTGIKDKNGMEIFEGDILLSDGWAKLKGCVKFMFSHWVVFYGDMFYVNLNHYFIEENHNSKWEVIGNIFENQDLLERK